MKTDADETMTNDRSSTDRLLLLVQRLLNDIWTSPVNLILVILIVFLLVKLFLLKRKPTHQPSPVKMPPSLPKMAKCDLTVNELRAYNGKESNDRILTAIYGDIFDVSRRSDLYGTGRCRFIDYNQMKCPLFFHDILL
jgi:hypothetical protein